MLATALLHFYLAPPNELHRVGKALVRLLHSNKETVYVVLSNIASMAATNPVWTSIIFGILTSAQAIFADSIAEFFVTSGEPLIIRNLKLEILTYIANESNINRILREFKEYVKDDNKTFVTNTIQAIGRLQRQRLLGLIFLDVPRQSPK